MFNNFFNNLSNYITSTRVHNYLLNNPSDENLRVGRKPGLLIKLYRFFFDIPPEFARRIGVRRRGIVYQFMDNPYHYIYVYTLKSYVDLVDSVVKFINKTVKSVAKNERLHSMLSIVKEGIIDLTTDLKILILKLPHFFFRKIFFKMFKKFLDPNNKINFHEDIMPQFICYKKYFLPTPVSFAPFKNSPEDLALHFQQEYDKERSFYTYDDSNRPNSSRIFYFHPNHKDIKLYQNKFFNYNAYQEVYKPHIQHFGTIPTQFSKDLELKWKPLTEAIEFNAQENITNIRYEFNNIIRDFDQLQPYPYIPTEANSSYIISENTDLVPTEEVNNFDVIDEPSLTVTSNPNIDNNEIEFIETKLEAIEIEENEGFSLNTNINELNDSFVTEDNFNKVYKSLLKIDDLLIKSFIMKYKTEAEYTKRIDYIIDNEVSRETNENSSTNVFSRIKNYTENGSEGITNQHLDHLTQRYSLESEIHKINAENIKAILDVKKGYRILNRIVTDPDVKKMYDFCEDLGEIRAAISLKTGSELFGFDYKQIQFHTKLYKELRPIIFSKQNNSNLTSPIMEQRIRDVGHDMNAMYRDFVDTLITVEKQVGTIQQTIENAEKTINDNFTKLHVQLFPQLQSLEENNPGNKIVTDINELNQIKSDYLEFGCINSTQKKLDTPILHMYNCFAQIDVLKVEQNKIKKEFKQQEEEINSFRQKLIGVLSDHKFTKYNSFTNIHCKSFADIENISSNIKKDIFNQESSIKIDANLEQQINQSIFEENENIEENEDSLDFIFSEDTKKDNNSSSFITNINKPIYQKINNKFEKVKQNNNIDILNAEITHNPVSHMKRAVTINEPSAKLNFIKTCDTIFPIPILQIALPSLIHYAITHNPYVFTSTIILLNKLNQRKLKDSSSSSMFTYNKNVKYDNLILEEDLFDDISKNKDINLNFKINTPKIEYRIKCHSQLNYAYGNIDSNELKTRFIKKVKLFVEFKDRSLIQECVSNVNSIFDSVEEDTVLNSEELDLLKTVVPNKLSTFIDETDEHIYSNYPMFMPGEKNMSIDDPHFNVYAFNESSKYFSNYSYAPLCLRNDPNSVIDNVFSSPDKNIEVQKKLFHKNFNIFSNYTDKNASKIKYEAIKMFAEHELVLSDIKKNLIFNQNKINITEAFQIHRTQVAKTSTLSFNHNMYLQRHVLLGRSCRGDDGYKNLLSEYNFVYHRLQIIEKLDLGYTHEINQIFSEINNPTFKDIISNYNNSNSNIIELPNISFNNYINLEQSEINDLKNSTTDVINNITIDSTLMDMDQTMFELHANINNERFDNIINRINDSLPEIPFYLTENFNNIMVARETLTEYGAFSNYLLSRIRELEAQRVRNRFFLPQEDRQLLLHLEGLYEQERYFPELDSMQELLITNLLEYYCREVTKFPIIKPLLKALLIKEKDLELSISLDTKNVHIINIIKNLTKILGRGTPEFKSNLYFKLFEDSLESEKDIINLILKDKYETDKKIYDENHKDMHSDDIKNSSHYIQFQKRIIDITFGKNSREFNTKIVPPTMDIDAEIKKFLKIYYNTLKNNNNLNFVDIFKKLKLIFRKDKKNVFNRVIDFLNYKHYLKNQNIKRSESIKTNIKPKTNVKFKCTFGGIKKNIKENITKSYKHRDSLSRSEFTSFKPKKKLNSLIHVDTKLKKIIKINTKEELLKLKSGTLKPVTKLEPIKLEPVKLEPVKLEPVKLEPVKKLEPVEKLEFFKKKLESVKLDPFVIKPVTFDPFVSKNKPKPISNRPSIKILTTKKPNIFEKTKIEPKLEPKSEIEGNLDALEDFISLNLKKEIEKKITLEAEMAMELEADILRELDAKNKAKLDAQLEAELDAELEFDILRELDAENRANFEAEVNAKLNASFLDFVIEKSDLEAENYLKADASTKAKIDVSNLAKLQAEIDSTLDSEFSGFIKESAELSAENKAKLEAENKAKYDAEILMELEAELLTPVKNIEEENQAKLQKKNVSLDILEEAVKEINIEINSNDFIQFEAEVNDKINVLFETKNNYKLDPEIITEINALIQKEKNIGLNKQDDSIQIYNSKMKLIRLVKFRTLVRNYINLNKNNIKLNQLQSKIEAKLKKTNLELDILEVENKAKLQAELLTPVKNIEAENKAKLQYEFNEKIHVEFNALIEKNIELEQKRSVEFHNKNIELTNLNQARILVKKIINLNKNNIKLNQLQSKIEAKLKKTNLELDILKSNIKTQSTVKILTEFRKIFYKTKVAENKSRLMQQFFEIRDINNKLELEEKALVLSQYKVELDALTDTKLCEIKAELDAKMKTKLSKFREESNDQFVEDYAKLRAQRKAELDAKLKEEDDRFQAGLDHFNLRLVNKLNKEFKNNLEQIRTALIQKHISTNNKLSEEGEKVKNKLKLLTAEAVEIEKIIEDAYKIKHLKKANYYVFQLADIDNKCSVLKSQLNSLYDALRKGAIQLNSQLEDLQQKQNEKYKQVYKDLYKEHEKEYEKEVKPIHLQQKQAIWDDFNKKSTYEKSYMRNSLWKIVADEEAELVVKKRAKLLKIKAELEAENQAKLDAKAKSYINLNYLNTEINILLKNEKAQLDKEWIKREYYLTKSQEERYSEKYLEKEISLKKQLATFNFDLIREQFKLRSNKFYNLQLKKRLFCDKLGEKIIDMINKNRANLDTSNKIIQYSNTISRYETMDVTSIILHLNTTLNNQIIERTREFRAALSNKEMLNDLIIKPELRMDQRMQLLKTIEYVEKTLIPKTYKSLEEIRHEKEEILLQLSTKQVFLEKQKLFEIEEISQRDKLVFNLNILERNKTKLSELKLKCDSLINNANNKITWIKNQIVLTQLKLKDLDKFKPKLSKRSQDSKLLIQLLKNNTNNKNITQINNFKEDLLKVKAQVLLLNHIKFENSDNKVKLLKRVYNNNEFDLFKKSYNEFSLLLSTARLKSIRYKPIKLFEDVLCSIKKARQFDTIYIQKLKLEFRDLLEYYYVYLDDKKYDSPDIFYDDEKHGIINNHLITQKILEQSDEYFGYLEKTDELIFLRIKDIFNEFKQLGQRHKNENKILGIIKDYMLYKRYIMFKSRPIHTKFKELSKLVVSGYEGLTSLQMSTIRKDVFNLSKKYQFFLSKGNANIIKQNRMLYRMVIEVLRFDKKNINRLATNLKYAVKQKHKLSQYININKKNTSKTFYDLFKQISLITKNTTRTSILEKRQNIIKVLFENEKITNNLYNNIIDLCTAGIINNKSKNLKDILEHLIPTLKDAFWEGFNEELVEEFGEDFFYESGEDLLEEFIEGELVEVFSNTFVKELKNCGFNVNNNFLNMTNIFTESEPFFIDIVENKNDDFKKFLLGLLDEKKTIPKQPLLGLLDEKKTIPEQPLFEFKNKNILEAKDKIEPPKTYFHLIEKEYKFRGQFLIGKKPTYFDWVETTEPHIPREKYMVIRKISKYKRKKCYLDERCAKAFELRPTLFYRNGELIRAVFKPRRLTSSCKKFYPYNMIVKKNKPDYSNIKFEPFKYKFNEGNPIQTDIKPKSEVITLVPPKKSFASIRKEMFYANHKTLPEIHSKFINFKQTSKIDSIKIKQNNLYKKSNYYTYKHKYKFLLNSNTDLKNKISQIEINKYKKFIKLSSNKKIALAKTDKSKEIIKNLSLFKHKLIIEQTIKSEKTQSIIPKHLINLSSTAVENKNNMLTIIQNIVNKGFCKSSTFFNSQLYNSLFKELPLKYKLLPQSKSTAEHITNITKVLLNNFDKNIAGYLKLEGEKDIPITFDQIETALTSQSMLKIAQIDINRFLKKFNGKQIYQKLSHILSNKNYPYLNYDEIILHAIFSNYFVPNENHTYSEIVNKFFKLKNLINQDGLNQNNFDFDLIIDKGITSNSLQLSQITELFKEFNIDKMYAKDILLLIDACKQNNLALTNYFSLDLTRFSDLDELFDINSNMSLFNKFFFDKNKLISNFINYIYSQKNNCSFYDINKNNINLDFISNNYNQLTNNPFQEHLDFFNKHILNLKNLKKNPYFDLNSLKLFLSLQKENYLKNTSNYQKIINPQLYYLLRYKDLSDIEDLLIRFDLDPINPNKIDLNKIDLYSLTLEHKFKIIHDLFKNINFNTTLDQDILIKVYILLLFEQKSDNDIMLWMLSEDYIEKVYNNIKTEIAYKPQNIPRISNYENEYEKNILNYFKLYYNGISKFGDPNINEILNNLKLLTNNKEFNFGSWFKKDAQLLKKSSVIITSNSNTNLANDFKFNYKFNFLNDLVFFIKMINNSNNSNVFNKIKQNKEFKLLTEINSNFLSDLVFFMKMVNNSDNSLNVFNKIKQNKELRPLTEINSNFLSDLVFFMKMINNSNKSLNVFNKIKQNKNFEPLTEINSNFLNDLVFFIKMANNSDNSLNVFNKTKQNKEYEPLTEINSSFFRDLYNICYFIKHYNIDTKGYIRAQITSSINVYKNILNDIKRGFLSTQNQQRLEEQIDTTSNSNNNNCTINTISSNNRLNQQTKIKRSLETVKPFNLSNIKRSLEKVKPFNLPKIKRSLETVKPFKLKMRRSLETIKPFNTIKTNNNCNDYGIIPYVSLKSAQIKAAYIQPLISNKINTINFNTKMIEYSNLIKHYLDNLKIIRPLTMTPNYLINRKIVIIKDIINELQFDAEVMLNLNCFSKDNLKLYYRLFDIKLPKKNKSITSFFEIPFYKISQSIPTLNQDNLIFKLLNIQKIEPQVKMNIRFFFDLIWRNGFGEYMQDAYVAAKNNIFLLQAVKVEDKYPFLNLPLKQVGANVLIKVNNGINFTFRFLGVKGNLTQITIFTDNSYISFFHILKLKNIFFKTKGLFLIPKFLTKKTLKTNKTLLVRNKTQCYFIKQYELDNNYQINHDIYIITGDNKPVQAFTKLSSYNEMLNPEIRSLLQFDFGYIKLENMPFKTPMNSKFTLNIDYRIHVDKSFSSAPKIGLYLHFNKLLNTNSNFLFAHLIKQSNDFISIFGLYIRGRIRNNLLRTYKTHELLYDKFKFKFLFFEQKATNLSSYQKHSINKIFLAEWRSILQTSDFMKLSAQWLYMYRNREFIKNVNRKVYNMLKTYNTVDKIYAAPYKNYTPFKPVCFKSSLRYILFSKLNLPNASAAYLPKFLFEDKDFRLLKIFANLNIIRRRLKNQLEYYLYLREYKSFNRIFEKIKLKGKEKYKLPFFDHFFNQNIKMSLLKEFNLNKHDLSIKTNNNLLTNVSKLKDNSKDFDKLAILQRILKFILKTLKIKFKDFMSFVINKLQMTADSIFDFYQGSDIKNLLFDFRRFTDYIYIKIRKFKVLINKEGWLIFPKNKLFPNVKAAHNDIKEEKMELMKIIHSHKIVIPYWNYNFTSIFSQLLWSYHRGSKFIPLINITPSEMPIFSKGQFLNITNNLAYKDLFILFISGDKYSFLLKSIKPNELFSKFNKYLLNSSKTLFNCIIKSENFFKYRLNLTKNGIGIATWSVQSNYLLDKVISPRYRNTHKFLKRLLHLNSNALHMDKRFFAGTKIIGDADERNKMPVGPLSSLSLTKHYSFEEYYKYDTFKTKADLNTILTKKKNTFKIFNKGKINNTIELYKYRELNIDSVPENHNLAPKLHSPAIRKNIFKNYKHSYSLKNRNIKSKSKKKYIFDLFKSGNSKELIKNILKNKPFNPSNEIQLKIFKKYNISKKNALLKLPQYRELVKEQEPFNPYHMPHATLPRVQKIRFKSSNYSGIDWKFANIPQKFCPNVLELTTQVSSNIEEHVETIDQTENSKVPAMDQKNTTIITTKQKTFVSATKDILFEFYEAVNDFVQSDFFSWITFHEYREELLRNQTEIIPTGMISQVLLSFFTGTLSSFMVFAADYRRAPVDKRAGLRLFSFKFFLIFCIVSTLTFIFLHFGGMDIIKDLIKSSYNFFFCERIPQRAAYKPEFQRNYTSNPYNYDSYRTAQCTQYIEKIPKKQIKILIGIKNFLKNF